MFLLYAEDQLQINFTFLFVWKLGKQRAYILVQHTLYGLNWTHIDAYAYN